MSKFFAYLNRMKYIKRWSLMRSIREENIMEHTQQVAVIAHALALITNKMFGGKVDEKKVVLLAQYHEVGEVITGDLPTPIKYFNPEIGLLHLIVNLRQTLVLGRAFQRTVVEVDADGCAIVEELRSPVALLGPDSHQGVFVGSAHESKLTVGNNRAVDSLFC